MVERRNIMPSLHVVASLAARFLMELPAMRIGVAPPAGKVAKPVSCRVLPFGPLGVTAGACNRRVGSLEWKPRRIVASQREPGRPEPFDGVALSAAVFVHGIGELRGVRVPMAVRAQLVPDAIGGGPPGWPVAIGAGDGGVAAEQRISAPGMLRNLESGRLPSIGGVAASALAAIGAGKELAPVCVLVACFALIVSDRSLEVG
jgi:hypothetical protein